jgi:hypothetical protein
MTTDPSTVAFASSGRKLFSLLLFLQQSSIA